MFRIISVADFGDNKSVCISKSEKGITIAQRMRVKQEESNKSIDMFLKGAFHIDSVSQLCLFRDAINIAIEELVAYEEQ